MPVQKYTMEKQLEIGREAYEELIRTKYDYNTLIFISEKYGYAESKIKELIRRYRKKVIDPNTKKVLVQKFPKLNLMINWS